MNSCNERRSCGRVHALDIPAWRYLVSNFATARLLDNISITCIQVEDLYSESEGARLGRLTLSGYLRTRASGSHAARECPTGVARIFRKLE